MAINTNKLKTFAQNSRDILIDGVKQRIAFWGFNNKGEVVEEPTKIEGGVMHRGKIYDNTGLYQMYTGLRSAIKKKGVSQVAEEAAYTWFNRIMAIRILAKNRYIQSQIEFGEGGATPIILQYARRGQVNYLSANEKARLDAIITDYQKEKEAFAILLIAFCNSNTVLKNVFGSLDDFSELLLPDNILAENGFVYLLNNADAITDEDYRQVELIGWLYQFYISKKKDEVFKAFKNNKKAEKEDIPAATQIFTPNWIVKYMVQNTVGQLWLDLNPHSPLKDKMKYRVEPAEGNPPAEPIIKEAAELKLLDPASGSSHILVEAFDLLFDMYKEEYYTDQDAVLSILEKNIYGLDIDRRAVQLGQFAILLKAAAKWPGVLEKELLPMVYAMPEPKDISRQEVLDFLGTNGTQYEEKLTAAIQLMQDAQNLGSVMIFDLPDEAISHIKNRYHELKTKPRSFNEEIAFKNLQLFIDIILVLTQKYPATAANPPYLGPRNMNGLLKKYIDSNYEDSKADLFAVFIEVSLKLLIVKGISSIINQESWLFNSSYKNLRKRVVNNFHVKDLLHLGVRTFDEVSGEKVRSVAFTLRNTPNDKFGTYYKLTNHNTTLSKKKSFLNKDLVFCNVDSTNFNRIEGFPFAYWISEKVLNLFDNYKGLSKYSTPRKGNSTSDNNRFLRLWHEVDKCKIGFNYKSVESALKENKKWIPYNKGGGTRKWYGYNEYLIDWTDNGSEIRKIPTAVVTNESYYMKQGLTWSAISSKTFGIRYIFDGFIFDNNGCCLFNIDKNKDYLAALLNSKVFFYIMGQLNPALAFHPGDIKKFPVIESNFDSNLPRECLKISIKEWNLREISWDFNGLQNLSFNTSINTYFKEIINDYATAFFVVYHNEFEINNHFINLYDLSDELTTDVALKDITILQEELDRYALEKNQEVLLAGYQKWKDEGETKPIADYVQLPIKKDVVMQQLISYAIGTMMGRYRLDKPGLHIAHPNPSKEEVCTYKYNGKDYQIDDDGIMPLMGSGCAFADDAYNRMKYFIEVVWGEDTLTENINFLEECLNTGIEKYLVKDFWGYHCKMYSKRPIYWLFSSKKGAFQVLVYMHRMNKFTCEKIRSNYLMKHITNIDNQIQVLSQDTASLSRAEMKKLEQLKKDYDECKEYDMYLKDIADKQIEFDLDDGVVENYKLFEGVVAPIK